MNLRQLFADFPTSDPVVRLVILLTAFLSVEPSSPACVSTLKAKLEPLKLGPITLADMLNLLIHPFIDRHAPVFEYMKVELESPETGRKGLTQEEMKTVVENVATRLLEIDCKVRNELHLLVTVFIICLSYRGNCSSGFMIYTRVSTSLLSVLSWTSIK